MQLAYHSKDEKYGWSLEKVAPITDAGWTDQDIWAYDYLTKGGNSVITMGWSMWSLVSESQTVSARQNAEAL